MKSLLCFLSVLFISESVIAQESLRNQYLRQQAGELIYIKGCEGELANFCRVAFERLKVAASDVAQVEFSFDRYFADTFVKLKTGQILLTPVNHERGSNPF